MADVLISLDDKREKKLRELALEMHEGRKGALTETVSDAIDKLYEEVAHRQRKKASLDQLISIMEKGYHFGKRYKPYEKRSELYASRFKDLY